VVDDGSSDNSRDVIERYGSRLRAIFKDNGGQASAFNVGFAASDGEVVIFLDADDVLLPEAAEHAAAAMSDRAAAKFHWPLRLIHADGRETGELMPSAPL